MPFLHNAPERLGASLRTWAKDVQELQQQRRLRGTNKNRALQVRHRPAQSVDACPPRCHRLTSQLPCSQAGNVKLCFASYTVAGTDSKGDDKDNQVNQPTKGGRGEGCGAVPGALACANTSMFRSTLDRAAVALLPQLLHLHTSTPPSRQLSVLSSPKHRHSPPQPTQDCLVTEVLRHEVEKAEPPLVCLAVMDGHGEHGGLAAAAAAQALPASILKGHSQVHLKEQPPAPEPLFLVPSLVLSPRARRLIHKHRAQSTLTVSPTRYPPAPLTPPPAQPQDREPDQVLSEAFAAAHAALLSTPGLDCGASGCTATVALVVDDGLVVGNAGDCRCLVGGCRGRWGGGDADVGAAAVGFAGWQGPCCRRVAIGMGPNPIGFE